MTSPLKPRLYFRIPANLRDRIDTQVQRNETNLTALMVRYIEEGLARDAGTLMESSSLPEVRQAVSDELEKGLERLHESLCMDLQKAARRSDDRLAALIVKAAKSAGIAQRLIYTVLFVLRGHEFTLKAYEDAKEKTGKDLSQRERGIESSERTQRVEI
jgi:hypothetical protein